MGLTLTEKILKNHLVSGNLEKGGEISVKIDQTLTQDATGTMVYLQFESIGIDRVKTELSVSYIDHNTQQSDFRNMDDHKYLQSAASRFGINFSRPGNGICHQVHLERFGIPGKTLLGSDSHTPTGGGLGMIAIGAGGLDVATAMAGAPFYLNSPEVIGVCLTGKLAPMCSAKDVILTILKMETVKGGVGRVYEYFGDGIETLSIPERATITNMGAELGATTSVFPSDHKTREFMRLQNRESSWTELKADKDAEYYKIINLDLSEIVPMAACPHMPDQVVTVKELAGKKIDQIAIGSCTNSSINDLGIASGILNGKTISENVSLGISPGSRQVLAGSYKAGIIQRFTDSGARIFDCSCGPCIGMGFAPCSEGITMRTFNRNFKGRSGTKDAEIYLVSPETAAASALSGVFTDPRDITIPKQTEYSGFIAVDDGMIIPPLPLEEARKKEIIRGPNIKPCPVGKPVENEISADVLIKTGDNITTDHIMPAGSKILPLRSNIPEISKHVFASVDPEFYSRAFNSENGLILGGENYGQGSSREHAALAPMYLGIRAVAAKSFARIHKANLANFGIMALTFENNGDYEKIEAGDRIVLTGILDSIINNKPIRAKNISKDNEFMLMHDFAGRTRDILLEGGLLKYTKKHF